MDGKIQLIKIKHLGKYYLGFILKSHKNKDGMYMGGDYFIEYMHDEYFHLNGLYTKGLFLDNGKDFEYIGKIDDEDGEIYITSNAELNDMCNKHLIDKDDYFGYRVDKKNNIAHYPGCFSIGVNNHYKCKKYLDKKRGFDLF